MYSILEPRFEAVFTPTIRKTFSKTKKQFSQNNTRYTKISSLPQPQKRWHLKKRYDESRDKFVNENNDSKPTLTAYDKPTYNKAHMA